MNKIFTAPEARVLIVDDMPVNQKITAELLKPLNMTIDIAGNGEEALEKIFTTGYDLVFMDNMMPVMDGIEATREIRRRSEKEYQALPVIAITSVTSDETKKLMESVGFSDFLSKPFRVEEILACTRKWLPSEKIKESYTDSSSSCNDKDYTDIISSINIPGIDPAMGKANSGGSGLFLELLGDVHDIIDDKCALVEKLLFEKNIKDYTIQVHALKTTCRLIGAMELGEKFFTLEKLGSAEDTEKMTELTPSVLDELKSLQPYLEPYSPKKNEAYKDFDKQEVISVLKNLMASVDDFNLKVAEENMESLISFRYPEDLSGKIKTLKDFVNNLDYDEALKLSDTILDELE